MLWKGNVNWSFTPCIPEAMVAFNIYIVPKNDLKMFVKNRKIEKCILKKNPSYHVDNSIIYCVKIISSCSRAMQMTVEKKSF